MLGSHVILTSFLSAEPFASDLLAEEDLRAGYLAPSDIQQAPGAASMFARTTEVRRNCRFSIAQANC